MATTNPYQDRAEAQMMAANQPTQPVQQQPYNLFAQQKQTGYPNTTTPKADPRVAGEADIAHATPTIEPTINTDGTNAAKDAVRAARKAGRQVWGDEGTGTLGEYRKTTPITNTDELARAMGYTSPEEEERRRKASLANMRIMAVADAVRQIGNIANTINYAPAQQLTSPVIDEYNRYEKGKALRDAANLKYMTYQQQKAAQDQRAKQWEATFNYNAAKDAANAQALKDYRDARMKADQDKWKEQLAFNQSKWKDQSDLNERKFKQQTKHQNTMAGIASRNASTNAARLAWQKSKGAGGRTGSPYVLPTKNGYINLGRDLNSNQIGKKALFGKLKDAHIIDDVWQKKYDNMYTSEEQSALLNTAISQWLMTDDSAEGYMKSHFGATPVSEGGGLSIGWDDDEDDNDDGLSIGW